MLVIGGTSIFAQLPLYKVPSKVNQMLPKRPDYKALSKKMTESKKIDELRKVEAEYEPILFKKRAMERYDELDTLGDIREQYWQKHNRKVTFSKDLGTEYSTYLPNKKMSRDPKWDTEKYKEYKNAPLKKASTSNEHEMKYDRSYSLVQ